MFWCCDSTIFTGSKQNLQHLFKGRQQKNKTLSTVKDVIMFMLKSMVGTFINVTVEYVASNLIEMRDMHDAIRHPIHL